MKIEVLEGDKIYIEAGVGDCTAVYKGIVIEVDLYGIWVDEGGCFQGERIIDYISFEDITKWAVE